MKKRALYNTLRILCFTYLIIGLVIWFICFINMDYKSIFIDKRLILDDGHISYMWEQHDKIWSLYEKYTCPFIILSLPLYIVVGSSVSDGVINFLLYDIAGLYYLFVPCLLLWLGITIWKKVKKKS